MLICASVISCGLVLRRCSSISPRRRMVCSNWSVSVGATGVTLRPAPLVQTKSAMTAASARTGSRKISAARQRGCEGAEGAGVEDVVAISAPYFPCRSFSSGFHLEDAGPAKLGELGLVRVEHVVSGVLVAELEDATLPLHLRDDVGELGGGEAGAGGVILEEVGVQVERVDRVVLQDVDQIHAHQLAHFDLDGMLAVVVMEWDGVDGVEVVGAVEIHVEAAHHHDELLIGGWPSLFWIDDERAVEALGDV